MSGTGLYQKLRPIERFETMQVSDCTVCDDCRYMIDNAPGNSCEMTGSQVDPLDPACWRFSPKTSISTEKKEGTGNTEKPATSEKIEGF
jgi:hypothetical protein